MMNFKIGFGYDIHPLQSGTSLVLGGVSIPSPLVAQGHSDADVLLHAICDALLGALNLGDIGKHFPDNEEKYKNIDSKKLLSTTFSYIEKENYIIGNIDSTICLETPKISKYTTEMQTVIASILKTDNKNISIKATTSEKLGPVGESKGIEAYCIALLFPKKEH